MSESQSRRLFGVLVTYRRPALLARCLEAAAGQPVRFQRLVVVDNCPTRETAAVVERYRHGLSAVHVPVPENLGPAGGYALGMSRVLEDAEDEDLVALLDDNDPLPGRDVLGELSRFLDEMRRVDRATAGAALGGGNFDWRRLVVVGLQHERLRGPVSVDHLHGNAFPVYVVGAIRAMGTFDPKLFFGFEELEYGLRLIHQGASFYVHGSLAQELTEHLGGKGTPRPPRFRLEPMSWRRYYSLRNSLYILLRHGRRASAVRLALVRGIGKPLVNIVVTPRLSLCHLSVNAKAIRDAALGRMGRTLDPDTNYS